MLLHYKTAYSFWFQSYTIYFYLYLDDMFRSVKNDGQLIKTCGQDKNKNTLLCLSPKYENGEWKSQTNRELEEMSKGENIVKCVKGQRIKLVRSPGENGGG